jgi:hypothetical protein
MVWQDRTAVAREAEEKWRAEAYDLLPRMDADAFTIGRLNAEIATMKKVIEADEYLKQAVEIGAHDRLRAEKAEAAPKDIYEECLETGKAWKTEIDAAHAENDALRVENERLRKALEEIVLCKMDDDDKRYVGTLKTIAREALRLSGYQYPEKEARR